MANRLSIGLTLALGAALTFGLLSMAVFLIVWVVGFQISDWIAVCHTARKH
jgi:hypothetical protein